VNIDQIIEEELNVARESIKRRIAASFLGLGGPSSSSESASRSEPASYSSDSVKMRVEGEKLADALYGLIEENPGMYGTELAKALGFSSTQEGLFIAAKNRLMRTKRIRIVGDRAAAVYYVRAPDQRKGGGEATQVPPAPKRWPSVERGEDGRMVPRSPEERADTRAKEEQYIVWLIETSKFQSLSSRAIVAKFGELDSKEKLRVLDALERIRAKKLVSYTQEGTHTVYTMGGATAPSQPDAKKKKKKSGGEHERTELDKMPAEEVRVRLVNFIKKNPGVESMALGAALPMTPRRRSELLAELETRGLIRRERMSPARYKHFPGDGAK
jgi:hypothetical protein